MISDTHGYLDEAVFGHFELCDEIWHAGDFGSSELAARLRSFRDLRGVYGNIDDRVLQSQFPAWQVFDCEGLKVAMTHIGGTTGRYPLEVKQRLAREQPGLFISGHSHILKIAHDDRLNLLHINPGAAGKQGWHKVRTLVRLEVDAGRILNCEVIELGKR